MARPRKYPDGATAADYNRRSLERLRETGGSRKSYRFSARTLAGLEDIKLATGEKTETEILERLVSEEQYRFCRISKSARRRAGG